MAVAKEPAAPISLIEEASIEGLKVVLSKEVLRVTFKKQDDTIRTFDCTLNPEFLPPLPVKEGVEAKPAAPPKLSRNIKVFVIGEGWKSFNSDTLIDISRLP
jgi:hypothetical protein